MNQKKENSSHKSQINNTAEGNHSPENVVYEQNVEDFVFSRKLTIDDLRNLLIGDRVDAYRVDGELSNKEINEAVYDYAESLNEKRIIDQVTEFFLDEGFVLKRDKSGKETAWEILADLSEEEPITFIDFIEFMRIAGIHIFNFGDFVDVVLESGKYRILFIDEGRILTLAESDPWDDRFLGSRFERVTFSTRYDSKEKEMDSPLIGIVVEKRNEDA